MSLNQSSNDRILGLYGLSDSGKTTLIETLTKTSLKKYRRQIQKGITLKVGYGEYFNQSNSSRYFIDSPGHKCFSEETFRNMDLIDLGIYLVDSVNLSKPSFVKDIIDHYTLYTTTLKHYEVPFITVLNKAEFFTTEELMKLYERIKGISKPLGVVPCTSSSQILVDEFLKPIIERCLQQISERPSYDSEIVFRTIKSFDVNKEGVPTKELVGGILGGFVNDKSGMTKSDVLYYWDHDIREWNSIRVVNLKRSNSKIYTIQTNSDPFFFKNDKLKGTCFFSHDFNHSSHRMKDKTFMIRVNKTSCDLKKNERSSLLILGKMYPIVVKKQKKDTLTFNFTEQVSPHIIKFKNLKVVLFRHLENKILWPGVFGVGVFETNESL